MAVIVATNRNQLGVFTPTQTTLTASDTLTFDVNKSQTLIITNTTVGAVGPITIVGDSASGTLPVDGTGGTFDASVPYELSASLAAGDQVQVNLSTIAKRLAGTTVTVAGGTATTAALMEN